MLSCVERRQPTLNLQRKRPAINKSGVQVMLVRQECERQKCERHQCEANSANANSAKGSTVRMRQECECQQCECQQCDATSVRKKCDSSANANSANRIFFSSLLIEKFNNRVLRLPKKTFSYYKHNLGMQALWGASHGRHDPFSSIETKSCLFEEMSLAKQCTVTQ